MLTEKEAFLHVRQNIEKETKERNFLACIQTTSRNSITNVKLTNGITVGETVQS